MGGFFSDESGFPSYCLAGGAFLYSRARNPLVFFIPTLGGRFFSLTDGGTVFFFFATFLFLSNLGDSRSCKMSFFFPFPPLHLAIPRRRGISLLLVAFRYAAFSYRTVHPNGNFSLFFFPNDLVYDPSVLHTATLLFSFFSVRAN